MRKQILLNCSSPEVRVAILEGGQLAEIHIERAGDHGVVGNVYKGRVQRVLPGMQAAFLDIGFEKAAFLHASDFRHAIEGEVPQVLAEGGDELLDAEAIATDEIAAEEMVAIVEETSSLTLGEEDVSAAVGAEAQPSPYRRRPRPPRRPLEEKLTRGQEIIVQVSKAPMGTKGARVTSYVSLAGRYLVYMPTTQHIGVSRRIEDVEERKRLRELVATARPPEGGFIVRTVCEGLSKREIEADIEFLTRLWARILQRNETASAPSLLHSDLDLVERTVRDFFGADVGRVVVDAPREHQRVVELVEALAPRQKGRVHLHAGPEPIFDRYGVEAQIDKSLDRKVRLKSGGSLVIERTEALTAIDVNTGRYVGKKDQEETILKTNLEAAEEVVRQLRLRNIGGLIIIDFIDMEKEENRHQVSDALLDAVRRKDKAQTKILKISELGLVEMTRKRTRESLEQTLCSPCPHCQGTGLVKSARTTAHEILRRIQGEAAANREATRLVVKVNPSVAAFLYESQQNELDQLEQTIAKQIVVKAQEAFAEGRYEIALQ